MLFSGKVTLVLLIPFASFVVAGSSLTGVAPGASLDTVKNMAGNDLSYVDDRTFEQEMVGTHNKWRKEHGAKDVIWDSKLAAYAETISKKCEWGHSDGPYGENISAGYKNARESVDTWGNERNQYRSLGDYDKPVPPPKSGHFTQLVWANSGRIGCARTKCAGVIGEEFESWFVVCEYSERGNMGGEYTKNVFKPIRKGPERVLGVWKDEE